MQSQKIDIQFLKVSISLALLSLLPAMSALVGALLALPLLQSYFELYPPMTLETIIGIFFLASSLIVFNYCALYRPKEIEKIKSIGKLLLALVAVLFFTTLLFYSVFYLFGEVEVPLFLSSVRTSICVLAIGMSIFVACFMDRWRNHSVFFFLIPLYLSITVLTGYVIQESVYYAELEGIGMSIPTSLSIILLVFATGAGPARKMGDGFLLAPGWGGRFVRFLLPISILLAPFCTWVNFFFERKAYYSSEVASVIQVVLPCFLLSNVIGWLAYRLVHTEKEVEAGREKNNRLEKLNKSKNEFLSVLSHEMRTPMNSIIGFLDLLPTYEPDSKAYKAALEVIQRNAKSEMFLIESILHLSQLIIGKIDLNPTLFNLRKTLDEVLLSFDRDLEDKKIRKKIHFQEPANVVLADEERIRQIIWNLFDNAIKYTPDGGEIRVEVKSNNSDVKISIEDSGIGLSDEQKNSIFHPFTQADNSNTRKYGGLGIGLTIANELALAHGGKIEAFSPGLDKGSRFSLTLPL